VPARLPAGAAAAVRTPALDAVGAAPGRSLGDLRLVLRREALQRLGKVDQLHVLALLELPQRRRQHRVSALLVMPDGLAVKGDSTVKWMPSSASARSVAKSAAVSGSHIPSGSRPNRRRKSAMPQRICVRRSRSLQRGRMAWLYAWAMALPWPRRRTLSASASSSRR